MIKRANDTSQSEESGKKPVVGSVLVLGGGIGGMQSSLDLADAGFKVYMVEKSPAIGGVMAQLDKTFPTNDCSMCIMSPKLVECGRHSNIEIITNAEVEKVEGEPGNFSVRIREHTRYIKPEVCTGCGECAEACPVSITDRYEEGLTQRKAVYKLYQQAIPNVYLIEKKGHAPCRQACPLNVNAHGYIALIRKGKYREAIDLHREKNPFPAICARVCHHPCEDVCSRRKIDEPLAIRGLKRFIADYVDMDYHDEPGPLNSKKVAIVGAGPAGLTAAYYLGIMGYSLTIFEKFPVVGGMLAVGIPEYRLPRDIINREVAALEKLNVEIKLSTEIGRDIPFKRIREEFDAVYIATGAHDSKKIGVNGEDEIRGVIGATEYLREVNLGHEIELGKRVAVIGGGNAAIDAARVSIRKGADEVTIVYRRTRHEMPAMEEEIVEALNEGVKLEYLTLPTRIIEKDGTVAGMECLKMELGEPDESGRRRPIPVEGSEFILDVDMVIPAISQTPNLAFIEDEGFETTKWNTIAVNAKTQMTSLDGVFAGGDVVTGPDTVTGAMAAGRHAACAIHAFLTGGDVEAAVKHDILEKGDFEVDFENAWEAHRVHPPAIPVNERLGKSVKEPFPEVELSMSEEEAKYESGRCLNCGSCSECMECALTCKAGAIDHDLTEDRVRDLNVGAVLLLPGFDEFLPDLKPEFGYGVYENVLASIEFERMMSASGPFGGHIVRPSDHQTPRKVAFLQCVGSRDEECGMGYCSSVCCMYSIKEAIIAQEHTEGIQSTIFYMDLRAHGKDFDKYYVRAQDEYKIRFVRAKISFLEEYPDTKNLRLKYVDEKGELISEDFDLVVLAVGLCAPRDSKKLSELFGIELNKYGFAKTSSLDPLVSSREGVFVGGAFSGPKDIPETVAQSSGVAAMASSMLSSARGTEICAERHPAPRDILGEPPRIGAFICHCGINIGGIVNVPAVVEYVKGLPNVVYTAENLYTCSQDTQEIIKKAIDEHNLNRIMVASCTPRTHESIFRETCAEAGLNQYLFEMANIRDQCSWVHMREPEKATEKAKDLARMAIDKVRLSKPLKTIQLDVIHRGLVIGGGIAGMTAALRMAEEGFEVYLLEREDRLGGNLKDIYYTIDGHDVQAFLEKTIARVEDESLVQVYTGAEIVNIDGYVGNYRTRIKTPGSDEAVLLTHGVVIVATGAKELETTEYLCGEEENVFTQHGLERMLGVGGYKQHNPENWKNVAMIQCVGSREKGRPYCSKICCTQAVKNAIKLKELDPEMNIFIFYRDMRTYGFYEEYYRRARDMGVVFIQYNENEKPVLGRQDGTLEVSFTEHKLRRRLSITIDAVVLSTAIVPDEGNEELAKMLKVPVNADRFFLEAHMKLRPVEFATDGVFLAGMAHAPKLIGEAISQANAAVSRACTVLSKEKLETEGTVSVVDEIHCVGCAACEAVCAYAAIEIKQKKVLGKEKRVAQINPVLCKGCGACAATCRSGSIDIDGFSDRQIMHQIAGLLDT